MTVAPPVHDERWEGAIPEPEGDWDRDFWLPYARDVCGLDGDIIADWPTARIVGATRREGER